MGLNRPSERQRLREQAEDLSSSIIVLGHEWVVESVVETNLDKNVVIRLGSSRVIRGNGLGEVGGKGSRCSLLHKRFALGLRGGRLVHQDRGRAIIARRHVRHGGCGGIMRNRGTGGRRGRRRRGRNQDLSGGNGFQGGSRH